MKNSLEKVVYENTQLKPNNYVKLWCLPYFDKYYIVQKLSFRGWLIVLLALPFLLLGLCLIVPAKLLLLINEYTFNKVFVWLNKNDVLSILLNGNRGRYFFTNEKLTNLITDELENESNKKTSNS